MDLDAMITEAEADKETQKQAALTAYETGTTTLLSNCWAQSHKIGATRVCIPVFHLLGRPNPRRRCERCIKRTNY